VTQSTDAPSLWIGPEDPASARERLRTAVAALTRVQRLQTLVDHAFGGLLVGLCLATAAILAVRQMSSPYPGWQLAGVAIGVAVAVALLLGWRRRPDPLDVAIRADLKLGLKQRLSTAWEFMTAHGDDARTDPLALQAVRARLPARAAVVFPLRINRWGRLVPLAATALLLASVVDLTGVRLATPRKVDEQVVYEGGRLSAFAREMQARAQRDKLPRSSRQAAELERLGAHMESGTLNRDQALGPLARMGEALDQERMQALAEANTSDRSSQPATRARRPSIAPGLEPGAMLERMQRGALGKDDTREMTRRLDDLEHAGIPRQALQDALERHAAGADGALREILEKLARLERALKEDKELSNALEQVRRAQDTLGSARASSDGRGGSARIDWDDDEGADRDAKGAVSAGAAETRDSPSMGRGSRAASQADSSIATERSDAPLRPGPDPAGRVLRPQGQMRAGEEFTAPGRMLPRSNRPSVEDVAMGSEFAAQAEAVLSRDHYPEHTKEFVRRYFLHLSQGARVSPAQPPAQEAQQRE
jgi:hypothetical protein